MLRVVAGPEEKPLVRVETASGASLSITQDHPMVTDVGLKPAAALSLADRLLVAGGQLFGIASLSSVNYTGVVFNIALEGASTAEHLLIADGVITGYLTLQSELAGPAVAKNQRHTTESRLARVGLDSLARSRRHR